MARTHIDIDADLIGEVMKRYGLPTKREAVDFALRRLVGPVMSRQEMLAMEGGGWEGELESLRDESVGSV